MKKSIPNASQSFSYTGINWIYKGAFSMQTPSRFLLIGEVATKRIV